MKNKARSQQAPIEVVLCCKCRPVRLKNQTQDIERRPLCVVCGERTQNGLALCALCARNTAAGRRRLIQLPQNEFALLAEIRKSPLRDGLYEISMDAPGRAFPGSNYVKQLAQSAKKELVRRGVLEVVTVGGPQRRTVVRILNDNVQLSTRRGRPRQVRLRYTVVAAEQRVPVRSADDTTGSRLALSRDNRAGDSLSNDSFNCARDGAVAMPGAYESLNDRIGSAEASVPRRRRYKKRLRTFSQQTATDILERVKTIGIVRTAQEYNSSYVYVSKLCKSRGIAIPLGRMKKAA